MSKQENYLDELLNSVNRKQEYNSLMEEDISADTVEEIRGDVFDNYKMSPKAEAEFLMEFERELEGEDFDDFLKEFEENDIKPEDRLEASDMEEATMNVTEEDALLSMLGGDLSGFDENVEEPVVDEEPISSVSDNLLAALGGNFGGAFEEIPEGAEPLDISPAEAIDLSQMGDEDLINLLAGTDDLADIGVLLSKSDSDSPVEGTDPFALFAASEMADQGATIIGNSADTDKQEETKKGGFLDKLKTMLFGKDEEEDAVTPVAEPISLTPDGMPGVEELMDENAQILAAFAEAEKPASEGTKNGKAKKEKKKKEPKPKKAPKPKADKPKKEKKPKEVDNTPPLPKGPVALVFLLAASMFVLVYFGTDLIGYSTSVSKANELLKMGQYTEAAEKLNGLSIKEKDVMLQGKILTLAAVDSELSSYEVFLKNGRMAEALDSLICAAGRCEVNDDNTLMFDCAGEMGIMKAGITAELSEQFGMSYEEAIELYEMTERNRDEYTIALRKIMDELGIEWE